MSYGTVQAEKMTTESGYSLGAGNASSFKNRIINGNMTISQRNGTSSVTPATSVYTLDRWLIGVSQTSKLSVQQDAGAVTPPAGFTDYLGITSLSAYSITSTDFFGIIQKIEGFNTADLGWGTANAKTVTLSFWVRSSLTGTFGGSFQNDAANRSYPFSYTISAANTWEQKTITVAGDTTGTWLTNNGVGIQLVIGLGYGSTFSGTAGAWAAGQLLSSTGATSVVGTNGATFYLTGVQLEVGTVATSFDFRSYGTELLLCQRYCETIVSAGNNSGICPMNSDSTTTGRGVYSFKVLKRANPSVTFATASTSFLYQGANINSSPSAISLAVSSTNSMLFDVTTATKIQWATANLLETGAAGVNLFLITSEL